MKLSVSNIAWNPKNNATSLDILRKNGISNIDVALTLLSKSIDDFNIYEVKNFYKNQGFKIVGVQSLLYSLPNITLFESVESNKKLMDHLEKIFYISKNLGVQNLVFGSPKNRFIKTDDHFKKSEYVKIFTDISECASLYDCVICFEPNPMEYGCNFMTNTYDAIEFIKSINHKNFKLNLDISTTIFNKEDFSKILNQNLDVIKHIHLSSPFIRGLSDLDHVYYSENLKKSYYDGVFTMECLLPNDDNLSDLTKNVEIFVKNY